MYLFLDCTLHLEWHTVTIYRAAPHRPGAKTAWRTATLTRLDYYAGVVFYFHIFNLICDRVPWESNNHLAFAARRSPVASPTVHYLIFLHTLLFISLKKNLWKINDTASSFESFPNIRVFTCKCSDISRRRTLNNLSRF